MTNSEILSWLLEGDVSIQYQAYRDLLGIEKPQLQKRIEREGWGKKFLSLRKPNGNWGSKFYFPKWTSTHYTILDLKYLCISPVSKKIRESIRSILHNEVMNDGGIYPSEYKKNHNSDVCVTGMVLNYASYFHAKEESLTPLVDFLLSEQMDDGGFNCHSNYQGATHSSLHTTLSVLEGIDEYKKNGYIYRLKELKKAEEESREFILVHRLFRSCKTGNIIKQQFLQLHYPPRWYYDILKALDYFQYAGVKYDKRMNDAIEILLQKRTKEGFWKVASKYPGQIHFEMEKAGKPSRWNTLRAMRVLKYYKM